ncbi:HD domain-containing protein [Candidatus Roizmanbacteria bacterium]|nr:HD domain-containing protein [Candidatus Roizmanbacteria bacterium]
MSIKKDINLLYEMGSIRFIERTWRQFLNLSFANLAEHTLRVTWISLILAKHENVENTEKVIKMALIHDISEGRTGDVNYLSRQYTVRNEEKAITDILKDTSLAPEFIDLWKEYEKLDTIEAQIVKDADNLDVDFELQEQKAKGGVLNDKWKDMRKYVSENKLYTKTAKELWNQLQDSDPNDWHMVGNNRFTSGDWKG